MAYFQTSGIAIVTGSAGGIGQGAANALALAGAAAVIFADIDLPRAQKAAEISKSYATNSSYQALAIHLDVTSQTSVDALVSHVVSQFNRIDYLVNSAGVDTATYAKTPDLDPAEYDRVLATNTKGILTVSQAVIKVMQTQTPLTFTLPGPSAGGTRRDLGRGSIVNVTSGLGVIALPGKGAYTVSKHAAVGLTKQMAADVASSGIRVNGILPAWVRTPMFESECAKQPGTEQVAKQICPNGRVAEVDEIGNSIVYLLSPAASYVSGVGLIVDHGLSLGGVRVG